MALAPNQDYQTLILNQTEGVAVVANTPEQIFLATGSVWEPRMNGSVRNFLLGNSSGVANLGIQGATNALNLDLVFQSLTFQAWQSSGPIEFNMTLMFDAFQDAYTDVVQPMTKLQAMSLPFATEANSDILLPPGPSPLYPNRSRVSMRIGRFLYIHSVILKFVNNTFDTRYDKFGQPTSGQSELTISTINTPSRQDLTTFFVMNNGGASNTSYGTRQGLGTGAR